MSALSTSVNDLRTGGATSADYGLNLANIVINGGSVNPDAGYWDDADTVSGARKDSKKVVIFFTDGDPNHYNGFDGEVANEAISQAGFLKSNGTLIYSIGVFADADPSDTTKRFNGYMHGVSSNYPDATAYNSLGQRVPNSDYYKTASDSSGLSSIFEDIFDSITTGSGGPTQVEETEGAQDTDGYITFTDTLGDYTQIDDVNAIVYGNKKFTKTAQSTDTKYYFEGTVEDNPIYDPTNLSNIIIEVTKGTGSAGDTIKVQIPASLIPLRYFDIEFDEGAGFDDTDPRNAYGPYFQRQRVEIYHTYAKSLVERGLAYPCFCTEEELDKVRAKQEEDKVLTGYYGEYATCRNISYEEIEANIKAGKPYVLRLRSQGSPDKEITFVDAIKGEIKLPENIHDIVLLKKDGIPTYHFAHAIDDHLMRTTTVVRGGEWLASAPIHYELFHLLGFKMPAYAHTAHLMKFDEETGGKRKLSKRKDPELSLDYYRKDGYHPYTMKVYLLTLLNSNFEEWHEKFPDKDINEFPFSVEKMNQSGALFDKDKLHNICKNELSKLSEEELYDFLYDWARENEPENVEKWFGDREKMLQILRLYMGVGAKRRRKDLMYAKQIFELISYFFDGESAEEMDEFKLDEDMVSKILKSYLAKYDHNDDNSVWFNKLKEIADEHGFASDMKAYKANPENFKGNVSDIAEAVRIAVTGRANTPDLWTIVHIMGEEQMTERIKKHIK